MSNLVQTLLILSELYFLQLFGGRSSFFIAITDIVVFVHQKTRVHVADLVLAEKMY